MRATACHGRRPLLGLPVCTENLIRFDLMKEALNVGRDGRAWQNGFVERVIGAIRRECVDHIVALGEQHLRRFVKSYASYYNTARTHRSLAKNAPVSRPVQRIGRVVGCPGRRVASSIRPNLSFRYAQCALNPNKKLGSRSAPGIVALTSSPTAPRSGSERESAQRQPRHVCGSDAR